MLKAVLFDLDDTLLANDMDVFLPAYFQRLQAYAAPRLPQREFMDALMAGTAAMMADQDPSMTNRDVFWRRFEQLTGVERTSWEPFLGQFYLQEFPLLCTLTQPVPGAEALVQHCLDAGMCVVIATNPLFPEAAIFERLRWAGLAPEKYPYSLVTTYENMHWTKPNPAYYREILSAVECDPSTALMVGNDPKADIEPARAAGLQSFPVRSASQPALEGAAVAGAHHQSLETLLSQLQAGAFAGRGLP